MFDDVDEQLDNAGAASPEDLAKAVGLVGAVAGVALPMIPSDLLRKAWGVCGDPLRDIQPAVRSIVKNLATALEHALKERQELSEAARALQAAIAAGGASPAHSFDDLFTRKTWRAMEDLLKRVAGEA